MLEKIILNNFKSYKQYTEVDLSKTNYSFLPQNVSDTGVLKGAIFVGANASGKSNILISIKLLLDLLFSQNNVRIDLFHCLFSYQENYSIEYYFNIDNILIRYYIEYNMPKSSIVEKLYIVDKLMLERIGKGAKSYIADKNGVLYDENDVADDTLFLRTLYFNTKFAGNGILEKWMKFLSNSIYINIFSHDISSYGKQEVNLLKYLNSSGVNNINSFFDEYNFNQTIEYSHESKGDFSTFVVSENEDKKYIFFKRKGIKQPIPFYLESLGNQNFVEILPALFYATQNEGMLIIDELSSLHNDLEELLIKYFMHKSKYSQLFIASHSTNLLSNSLIRPDQEYSVEFHGNNGSVINRFSNEGPRVAQNIEKMYLGGVFGGLPDYNEIGDEDKDK